MTLRDKLKFWLALNNYIEMIVRDTSLLSLSNAMEDSLDYLKAFGGTEQRNIPAEYTQVEYIESDGNQYINTGYAPNADTEIKIKFSTTTLPSSDAYMFHSSDSGTARVSLAITQHLAFFGKNFRDSSNRVTLSSFTANTAYDITVNKDKTIVNSTEYTFTHTGVTLPTMGSIGLFGTRTGNLKCQGRVKSFSCNENNVLKINLIPCRRNSDSVLGMFDTVTGNFLTNAGTGTFTAGPNATPTPDIPMDIWCNNGVLKARHQSGLPLDYTLLEYIKSTGGQWIDTGVNDVDKVETELNMGGFDAYKSAFGNYSSETSDVTRFIFSGKSSNIYPITNINSKAGGGSNSLVGQIFSVNSYHTVIMEDLVTEIRTTVDDYSKAIEKITGTANPLSIALFANAPNGIAYPWVEFKYWRAYKNGVLVRNMIPAKNASNVVGMYDTVSGQFFTNQGTGTFTAGNPVSDPVEIYADGVVETIKDSLNNTATAEMLLKVGNYQDVQSIIDGVVTRNVGVKVLDGTENWSTGSSQNPNRFILAGAFNDIAQIPNENVGYSNCYNVIARSSSIQSNLQNNECGWNTTYVFCVRDDRFDTVAQFTAWLKDQYNAGTPVTIVYPLAQTVTEQVASQVLNVQTGDNILEITQASLSNLELEAKYEKESA